MPKVVDHDERRRTLTEALGNVVRRDGARAVSIKTVADEAGVSKSNVVSYFPSRGSLLAVAVEPVNTQAEELTRRRSSAPLTLDGATRTIVDVTIPLAPERRRQAQVWLLLLDEGHGDPELRAVLEGFNRRVRDGFERGVRAMQRAGLVASARDVRTEAVALHALVDGLSVQVLVNPRAMPRVLVTRIAHNHLRSLCNP